jgi:hypothetical protein
MKILKAIWNFLNSKVFGYVVVIILVLFLANQCKRNSDLKRDNKIKEQNLAAATDSINSYKNKNGELVSEKAVWILTEKQLKKENKDLYDKVKDQKGEIISLNHVVFGLKQDTSILHDTIRYLKAVIGKPVQLDKTTWSLPWELNYRWDVSGKNWDRFVGHTVVQVDTINFKVEHKTTQLDDRRGQIDLVFGEKVVDGKFNVYVTTNYPGLSPTSMAGYFVDPNSNKEIQSLIKKDHWFTGFSLSVGITPTWDFIHKQPTIVIGPTIGYTIYQW